MDAGAIAGEGLRIVATHGLGGRDLCDSQKSRLKMYLKIVGIHDLKFDSGAAHREM